MSHTSLTDPSLRRVTVLGCGPSGGVPAMALGWGKLDPNNPRNERTRCSILVDSPTTRVLIDTSPDLRQQALKNNITHMDAVLYTHNHADHVHGIDELRQVSFAMRKPIQAYADAETARLLVQQFPYAFPHDEPKDKFYQPFMRLDILDMNPFTIGDITFQPFLQDHGTINSVGYRIGDFAYSTDVVNLDEKAFEVLKGVKIWIVECLRRNPHPTHASLPKVLEWVDILKPEKTYLTHMNASLDYDTLMKELPQGIEPAYDGLIIDFPQ